LDPLSPIQYSKTHPSLRGSLQFKVFIALQSLVKRAALKRVEVEVGMRDQFIASMAWSCPIYDSPSISNAKLK